jgi:hypothetical protein
VHARRTVALFVVVGFLVGVVVASIVVPPVLTWYNEPGRISPDKQLQTVCNLPDVIRYATGHLIRGQLVGGIVGAILFFAIGVAIERRRRSTTSATTG